MNEDSVLKLLHNGQVKKVILDTDAYNEIDDQYAIAYAAASNKIELLSVNAAPFLNSRAESPKDGMEKSYREILNVFDKMPSKYRRPVYRGSEHFLSGSEYLLNSDAVENIIHTALAFDEKIFVVSIGAITNIACAILKNPKIIDKLAVIWLGGHSYFWEDTLEFNMKQDVKAVQTVFESGIDLIQIPCMGVCSHLSTSIPELEYQLKGKNKLCDYLLEITRLYNNENQKVWTKVIWDVSAVAALCCSEGLHLYETERPTVLDNISYIFNNRHDADKKIVASSFVDRDIIFSDVFNVLASL